MATTETVARPRPDAEIAPRRQAPRRRRLPSRLARIPADLALLLAVAAVSATAWSLVMPALQGPDEAAHVAYVQRVIETRELPQKIGPGAGSSTELNHAAYWGGLFPLIGNLSARPGVTEAEVRGYERSVRDLPPFARSDGTGFTSAANNPPLYYLYEGLPYLLVYGGDFFDRLLAMRLGSVLLLLVAVACTWLLAAEVLPRPRWARTLAAGAVAVHPELCSLAGTVNPDLGLTAIWSAGILAAVRLVRRGPTTRRVVALGALCAASALTQPRGLPLAAPGAVALLLALHRFRPGWRTGLLWCGLLVAILAVGVGGYYYVIGIYGSGFTTYQVTSTLGGGFNVRQFLSYVWQFYLPRLGFMSPMIGPPYGFDAVYIRTFFGTFASLEVTYPERFFGVLRDAALLGLGAMVVCLALRWRAVRRHWRTLAVLVTAAVALIGALHVAAYRALQANGGIDPVLVGRYLFPLISLFGLAIAFVASSLPRKLGPYAGAAVLATGVVMQITGLGLAFTRFYG